MDLNAANPPQQSGQNILLASTGITRTDVSTSFGGYAGFDTSNRFAYYSQLARCTPHALAALMKYGLSLVKGLKFGATNEADAQEFEEWSERVNFFEQAQTVATLLGMNGTFAGIVTGAAEDLRLKPLLMSKLTIVPDGVELGSSKSEIILEPPVTKFIIDEASDNRVILKPEVVVYGSALAYLGVQPDILNRDTYGIYGISLMDSIELSIRYLLAINKGYAAFVSKYGNGRYVFDFAILKDIVDKGIMTYSDAQRAVDDWMEKHKNLKQNEDIAGIGLDVKAIDANGSLDVMAFKKSLENDIDIGLFQSPLSMGDSKGSTYAAGYVSEEDRMMVLESQQRCVRSILKQFVDKRLVLLGKAPGSVWPMVDELSKPTMTAADINEWAALGRITDDEARAWAGFPKREP